MGGPLKQLLCQISTTRLATAKTEICPVVYSFALISHSSSTRRERQPEAARVDENA